MQIEEERYTSGRHAVRDSCARMRTNRASVLQRKSSIVGSIYAQKDARRCPAEPIRGNTRIPQGFPCDLKQQALLRVHGRSLARRNPEERWIELIKILEEAPPSGVHLPVGMKVRIVITVGIPSIGRNFRDCVLAVVQKLPIIRRRFHSTGKTTSDTDNRNWLGKQEVRTRLLGSETTDRQSEFGRRKNFLLAVVHFVSATFTRD